MTYDEMIAVLQAAKEGKKIQFKLRQESVREYEDTFPIWNFDGFDYRVKPEQKLRPYANAEEFLAAMKEHGPYLLRDCTYFMPILVDNDGVIDKDDFTDYEEMVEYTWQDGHPCGIEE